MAATLIPVILPAAGSEGSSLWSIAFSFDGVTYEYNLQK